MVKRASQPVSAFVFDTLGIIFWIAAAFCFYREETMQTVVPADGFASGIANFQLMEVQGHIFMFACALAVIGTLFLGTAAIVKAIYKITFLAGS